MVTTCNGLKKSASYNLTIFSLVYNALVDGCTLLCSLCVTLPFKANLLRGLETKLIMPKDMRDNQGQ